MSTGGSPTKAAPRTTKAAPRFAAATRITLLAALGASVTLIAEPPAHADDRVDFTTTWYQESRRGTLGGLTVIHPQLDLGVDIGDHTSLGAGYSADVVTGATAAVYSVDAVSTATTFDDVRQEGRLSLGFSGRRSGLVFSAGAGVERDYTSINFGASGNIDLPGKNTNLALSYNHSMDQVCDKANVMATPLERRALSGEDPCDKNILFGQDNIQGGDDDNPGNDVLITTWRDLSFDTTQATLTQNLSPTLVGQISAYGQVIRGFQSNPYRRVRVGQAEPQESIPDVRARAAITARLNRYFPALRGAIHATLRGYSDTWGIDSGTAELAYSQYAGNSLLLRFRARVYQQTEAVFFKDAFFYETESTAGAFFTGDRELGRLRNILVGGKLTLLSVAQEGRQVWGVFDKLQFNLKADVLLLDELPANNIEDNLAGIDNQFLSSGQLLDAFVLQLGLLLAY